MFDFVRKHTKIMMGLMFLLIIPAFVVVGGKESFRRFNEGGDTVATVAGHDIKQADWDQAHRTEVQRILASRPDIDTKLLDSPEAHYATLEKLVQERVLAAAADKSHLVTSDSRLARTLQEDSAIASLRKADGSLDIERYKQLLAAQGMTPEMFEARVRSDLSQRQVVNGVVGTAFSSKAEADLALNALLEKREVQVALFRTADFASKVTVSDADLEAWYKDHPALFQAPEQASIEYVVLDLDAVKKSIVPNEQDLRTYFKENADRLAGKEERRASHILINAPKDASADDRKKARAKAEELLAQVRKTPASFADVAKKNSQDTGSAVKGGDLDYFGRGAMVKPFEDAAFALKKGDISDIVESDFGFHIIQLTDIRAPKQRSFEEMRPELEAELKNQQAQRKFAEVAESFTNGVYEQSDSLKPIAERLKLDVQTAAALSRAPAPGAKGVLASPKFLNAVFSSDSIEKKRNTEAVETAPGQLVSGRITQYTAAHTRPFAEVKEQVRVAVIGARATELAKKEGLEKLAAWKANPASATLPAAVAVSREDAQQQSAKAVDAALRADISTLPAWTSVDLGEQGYAVVKINKLVPREALVDATLQQGRAQYTQGWASAEGRAYYNTLKERFKVKINAAKPVAKSAFEAG
ncbi:SurA N-terminal domain-containing protein [Rhodoferax sp.]|uniref:peptidylprolyl isomerase n=1 Tax=Rhodoferax sp. TaxID=50421 RepID=UPI00374D3DCD